MTISPPSDRTVHQPVPTGEFTAGLTAAGVPAELVAVLAELFDELRSGRNATPTDVRRATGRPPRSLADVLATAAADPAPAPGR
ncbi:Rossmann-fold NAD(P)-binding domain-containing protein [Desertihabitans aurantiacus]|uniref:hypothetical protein n=1 Tax=Desertihabitans aurantiacus TaxID=2282477 RepID=UPI0013004F66|nr:hypothetical protein [Desertihabitans aurantiacus]